MDIREKIQLGENQNVNAINVENNIKFNLSTTRKKITEYDVRNVIDVTTIFDIERENNEIYRIHGEIEYLSLTNNLPVNYSAVTNFFSIANPSLSRRNIISDFKFYLVKAIPPSGYTLSDGITTSNGYVSYANNRYRRDYQIIATPTHFDIYKAGFSRNIFDEQQYAFNFNIDFDITDDVDGLGFPLTEIYLYAEYQPTTNGYGTNETLGRTSYSASGDSVGFISYVPSTLNIGDVIIGDVVTYSATTFEETLYNRMQYQITIPYGAPPSYFKLLYNPFIPIKLRVFSDDLERVNTGTTSNDELASIPNYAISIDGDGNVVWRDLLQKGFIDPLTDIGVDYPFINNRHYVFNNIVLSLTPNMNDLPTSVLFTDIQFNTNQTISNEPTNSVENLAKKC